MAQKNEETREIDWDVIAKRVEEETKKHDKPRVVSESILHAPMRY